MTDRENIPENLDRDELSFDTPQQAFYIISIRKFLILYLMTSGLYGVYWFYKHWKTVKVFNEENIIPVLRGFFAIFFIHALFSRIDQFLDKQGRRYVWNPMTIASLFVVLSISQNLLSRMDFGFSILTVFFISLWMLLGSGWILIQAQRAANRACSDPFGATNDQLTQANMFWLTIGVLPLLFMLFFVIFPILFGLPLEQ